jgi:SAM-dependent methyltransferase
MTEDAPSRRTIFEQVAADYDAVRPGYPEELIADVIDLSAIPEGGRILEIGCGTGQATIPFAERGYRMLCLDIGRELAALAAGKCRRFPQVDIQTISFEDWPAERAAFDLVISATAFHWVRPEVGYPKAAEVLRPMGSIATFLNMHPLPFTGFFEAVQEIYQRVVPEWAAVKDFPPTEERMRATAQQINDTGLFQPVTVRCYPWMQEYTREQHLRLLNTYSGHHALEEPRRNRLFGEIGALIDRDFGGVVQRPYLSVLYIGRKK